MLKKNKMLSAYFSEVHLGEKWMLNPNILWCLLLNLTTCMEWKAHLQKKKKEKKLLCKNNKECLFSASVQEEVLQA